MKISILTAALLMASVAGAALADSLPAISPPSMVGTWKATGDVGAARSGAAVSGWPKTDHALFDLQPRPMVVVEVQKGRDIAGYEVFADKSKEPFVGVFKHSGHLLISTNRGIATAEFYGADMEWCWVDNLDKNAIVSCDVMHKDGGGK